MNELTRLSRLLCGEYQQLGELSQILEQLGQTIDEFALRCFQFIAEDNSPDITAFGPYCGRTVLETACTILIGRLDPFRLLLVKHSQQQSTYKIENRNPLAIQWSEDILRQQKPPKWENLTLKDILSARALLTDYIADLYWKPALKALQDERTNDGESEWLKQLQQFDYDNPGIVPYFRQIANKLYPSLSKGVHQELIIPSTTLYDSDTIKELLKQTMKLVAQMALLSHYIPTTIARIHDSSELLQLLQNVEEKVQL